MKNDTRGAIIFFGIYFLLLPACIFAFYQDGEQAISSIIFGVIWWLLCLPGLIILFSMFESLKRRW